ncbi:unnamed protein product [Symbiodinium sp. CCMP2592]|nr:unnamed protein product [Symbiodinium sp. CCMP2592]
MAYAAPAAPQAVSPTVCSVAPASGQSVQSQGQMSPPVLLRPRSLSPTPAARPPAATPSCPQTCQPTPRTQSSHLGRFAGAFPTGYVSTTSPRRERSLSPVGLPPVPVLSGIGVSNSVALPVAETKTSRNFLPRPQHPQHSQHQVLKSACHLVQSLFVTQRRVLQQTPARGSNVSKDHSAATCGECARRARCSTRRLPRSCESS